MYYLLTLPTSICMHATCEGVRACKFSRQLKGGKEGRGGGGAWKRFSCSHFLKTLDLSSTKLLEMSSVISVFECELIATLRATD